MKSNSEIATIVKPLSPTAARILLVLVLGKGASFTQKELSRMLGKSKNTIYNAAEELVFFNQAQYNGYMSGWSLPDGWQQLDLWSNGENDGDDTVPPASHGGAMAGQLPAPQGEATVPGRQTVDNNEVNFQKNLEIHPSSSSLRDLKDQEEERRGGNFQKNLEVRKMLLSTGIGPRSPKLDRLVNLNLDLNWVIAHIHVWRWRNEPTGYLIQRLEHGDAVPECGCVECQRSDQVPEQYREIIKR